MEELWHLLEVANIYHFGGVGAFRTRLTLHGVWLVVKVVVLVLVESVCAVNACASLVHVLSTAAASALSHEALWHGDGSLQVFRADLWLNEMEVYLPLVVFAFTCREGIVTNFAGQSRKARLRANGTRWRVEVFTTRGALLDGLISYRCWHINLVLVGCALTALRLVGVCNIVEARLALRVDRLDTSDFDILNFSRQVLTDSCLVDLLVDPL